MSKDRPTTHKRRHRALIVSWCVTALSLAFGLYGFLFQVREHRARQVVAALEMALVALADTTSVEAVAFAAGELRATLPQGVRSYARAVGAVAESLEVQQEYVRQMEARLVSQLPPCNPVTRPRNQYSYIGDHGAYFDVIGRRQAISVSDTTAIVVFVRLRIPTEEVSFFRAQVLRSNHLQSSHDFYPSGKYNRIEIPALHLEDTARLELGVFLKHDTMDKYPRYYRGYDAQLRAERWSP